MEKISAIQDYIDDAFDTWPELECSIDGLLGYVKEYNPCFNKKNNPDRAAHVILFTVTAIKKGLKITREIKNECLVEMEYLDKTNIQILQQERELLKKKFN